MTTPVIPDRPVGVPPGARYFPPAGDFSELEAHVKARTGRGYLRCHVPFLFWTFRGVMLQGVHHRALSVNKRTWSMGRCLIYSRDPYEQVPGVWVWSLADERAAEDHAGPS